MTEKPTYWLMNLHPGDGKNADQHAQQCLDKGYIGLGFAHWDNSIPNAVKAIKDKAVENSKISGPEKKYFGFYNEMKVGDIVLLFARHKPIALLRVAGNYIYNKKANEHPGIWCHHYRKVDVLAYHGEYEKQLPSAKNIFMHGTILPLRSRTKSSYEFIDKWRLLL